MTTVLVHEYLSGGGALDSEGEGGDAHAAGLLAQGLAMRDAMLADMAALPGVRASVVATRELAARAADADAVWSVAPETGGLLAAICASVPRGKWLGCTPDAIRIAGSKSATRRLLREHGVPVPDEAAAGMRVIVKPDDGAGATDTRVLDALPGALAPGMTAEQFLEGDAMSATLLCGEAGSAELLAVNRQRIAIDASGRLAYRGVEIAVEPVGGARGVALQRLASNVAAALPGLRGIVGIDLVWHAERGPVVIEVNPRVTSAYVGLSARLKRYLARDVLALAAR